jgi:hypothetical protein
LGTLSYVILLERYDREQPTISARAIVTQKAVVVSMCARIAPLLYPRVCYYHFCSCCQARYKRSLFGIVWVQSHRDVLPKMEPSCLVEPMLGP